MEPNFKNSQQNIMLLHKIIKKRKRKPMNTSLLFAWQISFLLDLLVPSIFIPFLDNQTYHSKTRKMRPNKYHLRSCIFYSVQDIVWINGFKFGFIMLANKTTNSCQLLMPNNHIDQPTIIVVSVCLTIVQCSEWT